MAQIAGRRGIAQGIGRIGAGRLPAVLFDRRGGFCRLGVLLHLDCLPQKPSDGILSLGMPSERVPPLPCRLRNDSGFVGTGFAAAETAFAPPLIFQTGF
ncbi:hypothetical protein [Neisseria polysaccharea]|uniref:hypothetical protein n=1 Tax=Neisseria polysaccharea TaxID=489 RepID=UPI00272AA266|nr:hypothetical protein [Neisseria polysaccharea]